MANNNFYAKKAQRASFIDAMKNGLPTQGNIKNTVIETVKDIGVGVIGGGLLGAVVGKPSLLAGVITTGLGHISGNKWLSLAGVGMMASNAFTKSNTVSGLEGMDGIKERVLAFKESLTDRLYLDKILKKKDAAISGMGNLQYFNYPNEIAGLAALDSIEQQLEDSAMSRMQIGGMTGMGAMDTVEAMEGGLADVADYNL